MWEHIGTYLQSVLRHRRKLSSHLKLTYGQSEWFTMKCCLAKNRLEIRWVNWEFWTKVSCLKLQQSTSQSVRRTQSQTKANSLSKIAWRQTLNKELTFGRLRITNCLKKDETFLNKILSFYFQLSQTNKRMRWIFPLASNQSKSLWYFDIVNFHFDIDIFFSQEAISFEKYLKSKKIFWL